ncbi:hypothetical protein BDZ97DRAFT_1920155 [Flammula alnicola]|nr:hypothetical protein BDZ97DRAFT_1920155 [Flammula alnicola]
MDPNGNFNPIYEFLRAAFPLQNNDNGGNEVAQAGGDHQADPAEGSQAPQQRHTDIQMDHADDDEMPDLQEVSDSSDSEGESESDRDAEEVEMQAVDDDDMPPLIPLASSASDRPLPPSPGRINRNRRARVEDDEDEERDRRHPSQRIGNPSGSSTPQTTPQAHASSPTPASDPRPTPHVQHHIFHVNMSARGGAPNNDPLRFFQHMMPTGGNNAPPANNTNNATPPPQTQQPQQPQQNNGRPPPPPLFGGVAVSFELGPGLPLPPLNGDPNAQPPNQPQLPNHLAELFTRIGMQVVGAGAANFGFGLGMDSEKEDPERARKLVDGLEEVPVGLVRRLERVGGTGGGMGEDETKGGDGGCAICWDRLVDADGEGFGVQETEKEEEGSESKQPRIVSLPFNIDPDNLTYVSWRRRQRERQQAEAAAAGAAQGANPGPVLMGNPLLSPTRIRIPMLMQMQLHLLLT